MTISEIKKLTPQEFVERYPFLQHRGWDVEKNEYFKDYWTKDDDAVKSGYRKAGDPVMEFYQNDFYGWNSLILCWAEKVREVFINNGDGKIPDNIWVSEIKEKYGSLRICFGIFESPYEKINALTRMVEHLSYYVCYTCGHIGRSSNEKKLITYRSKGYWVSYQCKKCAKKETWQSIKDYKIKDSYLKKWIRANPHYNLYKSIFNEDWIKEEGDWISRVISYTKGEEIHYQYDCHELIEGMF